MKDWMVSKKICINCGQVLTGYRNAQGLVKFRCPKCGLCMVSKLISRRHEKIDVFATANEIIEDN